MVFIINEDNQKYFIKMKKKFLKAAFAFSMSFMNLFPLSSVASVLFSNIIVANGKTWATLHRSDFWHPFKDLTFLGCRGRLFFYLGHNPQGVPFYLNISFSREYPWVNSNPLKYQIHSVGSVQVSLDKLYKIAPMESTDINECGYNGDQIECDPSSSLTNPDDMLCEHNFHGGDMTINGRRREY